MGLALIAQQIQRSNQAYSQFTNLWVELTEQILHALELEFTKIYTVA